jgi:hypothetical protein
MDGAIRESNLRDTFPLTPTTFTIELPKPGDLADSGPNRKRLDLRDWAQ